MSDKEFVPMTLLDDFVNRVLPDTIKASGNLYHGTPFINFIDSDDRITLDGEFTATQLEAIVYWMRTHGPETFVPDV